MALKTAKGQRHQRSICLLPGSKTSKNWQAAGWQCSAGGGLAARIRRRQRQNKASHRGDGAEGRAAENEGLSIGAKKMEESGKASAVIEEGGGKGQAAERRNHQRR